MKHARSHRCTTVVGTMLMLGPVLLLLAMSLLGVVLGSLGMDIHWNGSRLLLCVIVACLAIALCSCFIAGWRLRGQRAAIQ
jgi:hypothetical protein